MMSTINREAFLADPNVAEMVGWVAARFDDALGWTHTWVDRKNDNRWSCHGLRDAFLHYRWNGEAWAGTKTVLDAFRCELREAVKTEDVGRVVTVCENILQWGAWRRTTCAIYTDSNRFSCVNSNTCAICCRDTARRRSTIYAANPTIRPRNAA